MSRGYVTVWRTLEDSGILANADACQMFLYFMLKATHKERKEGVGKQVVDLRPGQLVTSRKHLALALGSSEQRVRTTLNFLEKSGIINQRTTNKYSVISIINYGTCQQQQPTVNQPANQEATSFQPAINPQTTSEQPAEAGHQITKQECKKEIINNNIIPPTPQKGELVGAAEEQPLSPEVADKGNPGAKAGATRSPGGSKAELRAVMEQYTANPDLRTALEDFRLMRERIRKPMTVKALSLILRQLDTLADDDKTKIEILEQSIMSSWQKVYALDRARASPVAKVGPSAQASRNNQGMARQYEQPTLPEWAKEVMENAMRTGTEG